MLFRGLFVPLQPPLQAALYSGVISVAKSFCSYSPSAASVLVECTLRDKNGFTLQNYPYNPRAYQKVTHMLNTHYNTTVVEEAFDMEDVGKGVYRVTVPTLIAGHAVIQVESDDMDVVLKQRYEADVPFGSVSVEASVVRGPSTSQWFLEDALEVEVVVTDTNGNMLCGEDSDVEVVLVIDSVNSDSDWDAVRQSTQVLQPASECALSERFTSFSTRFFFLQEGTVVVSVVVRGSSQSALTLHSFRLTVSSYTCPQNASSNFTCFDYPSESQAASRDFVFNCVGSPSSCSVGLVQTDRCEEHESYCWGYRSYKPWCSSALTPSLECACTSTSCITGQCYSDDSNCPLAPLCPSDYTLCSDYHCVKDPSECPTILACPTSMVLCGDLKRCGVSKEDCDFVATASCPPHQPLLCADGFTCVSRYDLCPTAIRCPPGFVRCEGGTCRESVDDCVATIPCPLSKPIRCSDGTCSAVSPLTCSSAVTCPPGFVATSDKRCISLSSHGTPLLSSSGRCPSTHVTCPDGTCATVQKLCPTPTQCPPGFVLCSDMSCRADERLCPSYKETCLPPLIHCSSGECVQRPEDCASQMICPENRPIRCMDGSCGTNSTDCVVNQNSDYFFYLAQSSTVALKHPHEAVNLTAGVAFPLALTVHQPPCGNAFPLYCSSMGVCVSSPANCPHQPFCPSQLPHRCPDGRCVNSETDCMWRESECEEGYVRCPISGLCRKSSSLCPILKSCGPYESLCSNSVCVSQLGDVVGLPEYLTENRIIGDLKYSFLTDATVFDFMRESLEFVIDLCVFEILNEEKVEEACCVNGCDASCIASEKERVRAQCKELKNHYPCEEATDEESALLACPRDKRRCFDGRCVGWNETCATITVCPRDRPVRCMNNACVHDSSECERGVTCMEGYVMCDDGSCATDYAACSYIVCDEDAPFLCWDQSCRRTPEDCPQMNECADGMYFCAVTGDCVYDRNSCLSNGLRVDAAQRALVGFCNGKHLCEDGSCRNGEMSCPAESCPEQFSTRCASGLCVNDPAECRAVTLQKCPASAPVPCFDGSCTTDASLCPLSTHCKPPFRRCSNGLCVISRTMCPITYPVFAVGANYTRYHPLLQFLRTDRVVDYLASLAAFAAVKCPTDAPFLCASGKCVPSPNYCHSTTPCSHDLLHNGNQRCLDGSCVYKQSSCSNATLCPSTTPVMCMTGPYSGMCVTDSLDCLQENGCPLRFPKRCSNGACVAAEVACPAVSIATGCPADLPVKCITGECRRSATECTLLNGCPPLTPFKSRDGVCYRTPKDDVSFESYNAVTTCPTSAPVRCWDGRCVLFPAECRASVGCDLASPIRCVSGECGTLPKQYPPTDFIVESALSSVIIEEREIARVRNDVCRPTPTCPPEQPYMCADMHCVSDYAHCRACANCTTSSWDLPFCPPSRPIYCPADGACVRNQGDCANYRLCPPERAYRCFTGECAETPYKCMYADVNQLDQVLISVKKRVVEDPDYLRWHWWWRVSRGRRVTVDPYPFTMCSNGAMQDYEECELIPQCTVYHPKRCPDGTCVGMDATCPDVLNTELPDFDTLMPIRHYLFPHTSASTLSRQCLVGELCSDGVCRLRCATSVGCGIDEIQCPDGRCMSVLPGVSDSAVCRGLDNCGDDEYRCFTGKCVQSLSECFEDHFVSILPDEVLLTIASQELKDVMLYNHKHEVYAYLASPAAAFTAPPEPFFLHITPLSMNELSRQHVIIDDANRATELRLNPVVQPATLLLSPAIHLEFIALRENTTIRTLQHPLILSFLKPASYAILPFVRYDNRIYRNPLHIQEDEVCPAILEMATWVCMNETSYAYSAGAFHVKVKSAVSIALMYHPLTPVGEIAEKKQTVTAVFLDIVGASLYVSVPLILLLLWVLVRMMDYRLTWEQNVDCYQYSRIHTDAEAMILKEKSHTSKWKQIDFSDVVKSRQGAISNPLAVHRILNDMYDHQMNEVKETAKKNEETICRLKKEKEAVMVRFWGEE